MDETMALRDLANSLLFAVRAKIEETLIAQVKAPSDWRVAGDMQHIVDLLAQIARKEEL